MQSIVNPSAEITPGYGLSTVVLKNGEAYSGRLASESPEAVHLVSLDGKKMSFDRAEITQVSRLRSLPCPQWAKFFPQQIYAI
jgi:quinoprotein glucose dehydrogenase